MKKKIISLILTFFIFFTTTISSFANPLAGIYLSYEAMMGLIALAGACGIVLQTDEDYWRFTNAVSQNWEDFLDLTDAWEGAEPYLKNLEEMVWNEYINRPKPEPEEPVEPEPGGEPLKLPWIPGLEDFFSKIGEDISPGYKYLGNYMYDTLVVDNYSSSKLSEYDIKYYSIGDERPFALVYEYVFDNSFGQYYLSNVPSSNMYVCGSSTYFTPGSWNFSSSYGTLGNLSDLNDVSIGFFVNASDSNKVYIALKGTNKYTSSVTYKADSLDEIYGSGEVKTKEPISYTPTTPTVEDNTVVVPSIPTITIPSFEEMPDKFEGQEEPIIVDDPLELPNTGTDTDTDTDTGTDTDTDTDVAFPSFGDSINFTPIYSINITEKFPFSLPWDIGRLFDVFDIEPKAPVFDIPIVSETITIDLTEFDEWAMICRFFVTVSFVAFLIFISTRLKG